MGLRRRSGRGRPGEGRGGCQLLGFVVGRIRGGAGSEGGVAVGEIGAYG